MRMLKRRVSLLLVTLILAFALLEGEISEMKKYSIDLPTTTGSWIRPDLPQIVTSENIFDYMNGAGELYMGYRFNHLEVYEYKSDSQDDILVELYVMETSDDAFGLLSLDWGGESVSLSEKNQNGKSQVRSQSIRALYGEGLLRIWSDNLYARVMAYQETPESREAVLDLGKIITSDRKNPPEPVLLKALSTRIDSDWKLRKDRMSFFRSYLVLNSIYYISPQNILGLDHSTEAVTAPYENNIESGRTQRAQFLLIKYENQAKARKSLIHFHEAFLPEHERIIQTGSPTQKLSAFKIEEGWLGYQLNGRYLVIVFNCPDEKSAETIIHQNISNLSNLEG